MPRVWSAPLVRGVLRPLLLVLLALAPTACEPAPSKPEAAPTATRNAAAVSQPRRAKRPRKASRRRPGDFEPPAALLLAVGRGRSSPTDPTLFAMARAAAAAGLPVVMLAPDRQTGGRVSRTMDLDANLSVHGRVLIVDHETPWIRDFGPQFVERDHGGPLALDFHYDGSQKDGGVRLADDRVPLGLASALRLPVECVAIGLHGGNLVTNGKSLGLTTSRTLAAGRPNRRLTTELVLERICNTLGIEHLQVLEPMPSEPTQHVDQFATFTAPNTVVIGQIVGSADAGDVSALDANFARIARAECDGRPLRIERVPMVRDPRGNWCTFTNVVYLGDRILMPAYRTIPPRYQREATRVFRRLLPRVEIVPIDCTDVIHMQGALRCLSITIPRFVPLPAAFTAPLRAARPPQPSTR